MSNLNAQLSLSNLEESSKSKSSQKKRKRNEEEHNNHNTSTKQNKKQKTSKKNLVKEEEDHKESENLSKESNYSMEWTVQDDNILKDSVLIYPSFDKLVKQVKFSQKFTVNEIEARWRYLLYNQHKFSENSKPSNNSQISKRVLWTTEEEEFLKQQVSASSNNAGSNSFLLILETFREKFHPSRTAKSLEAHYYRIKRSKNSELINSNYEEESNNGTYAPNEISMNEKENMIQEENSFQESPKEEEIAFPVHLGVIKSKHILYFMKSRYIIIGRSTPNSQVDVDINLEKYSPYVSRKQAIIELKYDCEFYFKNTGKCNIFINRNLLKPNSEVRLIDHINYIEINQEIRLIFQINKELHNKMKQEIFN